MLRTVELDQLCKPLVVAAKALLPADECFFAKCLSINLRWKHSSLTSTVKDRTAVAGMINNH